MSQPESPATEAGPGGAFRLFVDPPREYTPVPLWFWNDALSRDGILSQIDDFHRKEVFGFVIHPRMGLPPGIPYLSEKYLDFVEIAVHRAMELDMRVVLYDEGMYPSGSAHGQVVATDPEFAAQVLERRPTPKASIQLCEGETLVSMQLAPLRDSGGAGWLAFVQAPSRGTIRGIHFGEDSREPGAPLAADLLNPDAVACFMRLTHEKYYRRLSGYFGSTIIAMFTDEPSLTGRGDMRGRIPWTHGFLGDCLSAGLLETELTLLFDDDPLPGREQRKKYRAACAARLSEVFYRPLGAWCASHGIALTGHPAESDDMALLEHFQMPGQDLVLRRVAPEGSKGLEGRDSTLAKCAADAALAAGKPRSVVECFGACSVENPGHGWHLPPADLKWYADWCAVRGLNLFMPHAFYYSLRERRKDERPPDVGPAQVWWPDYHLFSRYLRRLSWLQSGKGNITGPGVLCTGDHLPWRLPATLYRNQVDFNYIEGKRLFDPGAIVENSRLKVGRLVFNRILVEDPGRFDGATIARLRELDESGLEIVTFNPDSPFCLPETLCADAPVRADRPVPDLRVSWRQEKGWSHLLLVNEGDAVVTCSLDCRSAGNPEIWYPWPGTRGAVPWSRVSANLVRVDVRLEPRESQLVVFDESGGKGLDAHPVYRPEWDGTKPLFELASGWSLRFSDQAASVYLPGLPDWRELRTGEIYSGYATYQNSFTLPASAADKDMCLDLGMVGEVARVWINGTLIEVLLWPPYRVDAGGHLKPGLNQVLVEVGNNISCRMDGSWKLSGLLGPVQLLQENQPSETGRAR
jgi:hypothetical protein